MEAFKVLVPLDGSPQAETPLPWLGVFQAFAPLRVRLLSVVDSSVHEDIDEQERDSILLSAYLREQSRRASTFRDVEIDSALKTGHVAPAILEDSEEFAPDLILLATHGRTGVSRWRLGSVTDKVVRAAGADTLVVGPHADAGPTWPAFMAPEQLKRILVPLDGSQRAEQALPLAHRLQMALGARIYIVRVVPLPVWDYGLTGTSMAEVLDSVLDSARTYLAAAALRLPEDAELHLEALVGSPADQLGDYVEKNEIDLIVMTSHGRTGVTRLALGSVTDRLLGGSCPVLVVRPAHALPAAAALIGGQHEARTRGIGADRGR